MTDPDLREKEVVRLLEAWPFDKGTTIVGGYAIAAYGGARYSVDIDFVVSNEANDRVTGWLEGQGFSRRLKHRPTQTGFDQAIRYQKGVVTIDLLIGVVRDREAMVDIPEEWISQRARRVKLDLLTGRVERAIRVARVEAIWALKLQSGRDQDLTDLFAISGAEFRVREVREIFEALGTRSLSAKLAKVSSKLESEKLYRDARSRLELKDTESTRRKWTRFKQRVLEAIPVS